VGVPRGTPALIRDVSDLGVSSDFRTDAATDAGKEILLENVMILVGQNGRDVSPRVKQGLSD
jgi:Cu/Ag efflux pump CusA